MSVFVSAGTILVPNAAHAFLLPDGKKELCDNAEHN